MAQQNAGALATVGYGTALAPIRTAIRSGRRVSVIATETRPRLQGAKLTAYELVRDKIPVTLITDSMAGLMIARGSVDKVMVGADRITRDSVFNKVGTYMIALAAKEHGIPFYVAAPRSTFDLKGRASGVKIEERDPREITHMEGRRVAPKGVRVINPGFDFTPLRYVKAFITDAGIISPSEIGKLQRRKA